MRRHVSHFGTAFMLSASLLTARFDVSGQQAAQGSGENRNDREKIGEVFGKAVYRDEIRRDRDLEEELHRLFLGPLMDKYSQAHKAELEMKPAEVDAVVANLKRRPSEDVMAERELRRQLKEVETQLAASNLTDRKRERLETRKQVIKMDIDSRPTPAEREIQSFWEAILCYGQRLENVAARRQVEEALRDSKLSKEDRTELEAQRRTLEVMESPDRFFAMFLLAGWKFERHLYDKFGGGRVLWQQAGLEAFDATRKWLASEERSGHFKITDPKLRADFYHYWSRHHDFMLTSEAEIREEFLEPEWAP